MCPISIATGTTSVTMTSSDISKNGGCSNSGHTSCHRRIGNGSGDVNEFKLIR